MKIQKQAFTLVELIVVIAILAILWTIAFISLEWYSSDSRDSTRISDMQKIKSSFEFYNIDAWKYPEVTSGYEVTYSWWKVWEQWIFWTTTKSIEWKLDKIPIDPLTSKEYTYSRLNTKQEFEIAWVFESDDISMINNVYAWDKIINAYVTWNYNWVNAKVSTWWLTYVLWVPTIIASEEVSLEDIYNNNHFVKTSYSNLPANYKNSKYNNLWEWWTLNLINTWSKEYELFVWNIDDLTSADTPGPSERATYLKNMQDAFTWTLTVENWVSDTMDITNFNWTEAVALSSALVNNTLWASLELASPSTAGLCWSIWINWKPICCFDDATDWKFWSWATLYCEFG